jgi:hypothetical protein
MSKSIQINGVATEVPAGAVAYKYADPIEDARWIYEESEVESIGCEDPSLIVVVEFEDHSENVEEIGDGFYEAADGTVIYSPEA